jgi:hypothetical protein
MKRLPLKKEGLRRLPGLGNLSFGSVSPYGSPTVVYETKHTAPDCDWRFL